MPGTPMSAVPLRRNRDFMLLQAGQLLSTLGTRSTTIAYPLLAAVATETGREAVVRLVGPPLGGVLFGLSRALPFVVDAASYTCSTLLLLVMRTPFQDKREVDTSRLRSQIAEGFRFLWAQPFLRTCALLFGLGNFIFPGVLLVIIVVGKRHG